MTVETVHEGYLLLDISLHNPSLVASFLLIWQNHDSVSYTHEHLKDYQTP